MPIILSAQTEKLLEEKLKSGSYQSADDVVHAARQALGEREARHLDDVTLEAIDRAEDEIDRGDVPDWRDVRDEVPSRFLKH